MAWHYTYDMHTVQVVRNNLMDISWHDTSLMIFIQISGLKDVLSDSSASAGAWIHFCIYFIEFHTFGTCSEMWGCRDWASMKSWDHQKQHLCFFISATFQKQSRSQQSEMSPTELWLKLAQANQCIKQLNFGSSLPQVKQCLSCEHVWFGSSQAMTIAVRVAQFGRLLQELFLAYVF